MSPSVFQAAHRLLVRDIKYDLKQFASLKMCVKVKAAVKVGETWHLKGPLQCSVAYK